MNPEYLEQALAMCSAFDYDAQCVRNAKELLENIKKANEQLRRVKKTLNHSKQTLPTPTSACAHPSSQPPLFPFSQTYMQKKKEEMTQTDTRLRSHTKPAHMKKCLQFCQSFNYTNADVDLVKKLYQKVLAVREKLTKAQTKVSEGTARDGGASQPLQHTHNRQFNWRCKT